MYIEISLNLYEPLKFPTYNIIIVAAMSNIIYQFDYAVVVIRLVDYQ